MIQCATILNNMKRIINQYNQINQQQSATLK